MYISKRQIFGKNLIQNIRDDTEEMNLHNTVKKSRSDQRRLFHGLRQKDLFKAIIEIQEAEKVLNYVYLKKIKSLYCYKL